VERRAVDGLAARAGLLRAARLRGVAVPFVAVVDAAFLAAVVLRAALDADLLAVARALVLRAVPVALVRAACATVALRAPPRFAALVAFFAAPFAAVLALLEVPRLVAPFVVLEAMLRSP
jgi:hypothetical protein